MRFCHLVVLSVLPFLVSAVPLADEPQGLPSTSRSHGIAIPIAKRRVGPSGGPFVDRSLYAIQAQNSVAKIQRGLVAYERNTGKPHPLSSGIKTSSTGKRDSGSNELTNYRNYLWYGTVSVGSPPVEFTVDFDTGSSDFFIPSIDCDSTCAGHKAYDPSASSTSRDLNKTFKIGYGDGSTAEGKLYDDTVTISFLTAMSQTLGAANKSHGFESSRFPPDGLMGMAFPSISSFNALPPFLSLVSQNKAIPPVFGFKLASSGSELFLGGVNTNLYNGDFTWVDLIDEGFWQAAVDSITVPRDGHEYNVRGNITVIFDTGTTLIIGNPIGIGRLYAELPGFGLDWLPGYCGEGCYTIPCDFNTPIHVNIGGRKFVISPETFNLGPISDDDKRCLGGAAWAEGLPSNLWIFGDVFLRNVYSAWDVGNDRIGFADLA